MLYTYPDYYEEFKCVADKCIDTCCAGWQIVIDDESYKKYKGLADEYAFKERLMQSVDWKEEAFKQDGRRRCAFLNEKNLCDLYTALGEEALCYTCASYPRHTEEYENLREITLSLSCPEVARIVLGKMDKTTFYTKEDDREEEFEDFDVLMFSVLQDIRSYMIDIVQDRSKDIEDRLYIIWHMANKLQEAIDDGDVFLCQEIIDTYRNSTDTINEAGEKDSFDTALELFKKLYRLEVLMEEWETQVDEAAILLYGRDKEYYYSVSDEFNMWLEKNMAHWQIQCEQIVVYFLSTYICGAVYDGWISSKVKMSVVAVFYIYEMLKVLWIKNDKKLTMQDIINVTYRFSRELEHSDINLDEMEECMNEI